MRDKHFSVVIRLGSPDRGVPRPGGSSDQGAQWGIELILGLFVDHLGNFEIGLIFCIPTDFGLI